MRADKKKVERLLKTARGQLDGIMRMMEEDRYCIDVSNQLLATQAILTKVECCVKDAILSEDADEKIEEVLSLLEKMMK